MNEKHEEAINAMSARLEERLRTRPPLQRQLGRGRRKNFLARCRRKKEKHKQELEDLQVHRQQDAEIHKTRLATLAKAMEDLQVELREETSKNATMTQELSVLKELAEVGSAEAQERVQYVERDRARERARLGGSYKT